MIKYITAEEFNNTNWESLQDKPFEDEWSRYLIKCLLEKYSPNVKSIYEYKGNNCLDLKLTMESKSHIGIEIKYRKDMSNKYPSHLINIEKYNSIVKKINAKTIQGATLISIWYDGIIWTSDITSNYTIEKHWQNKTTNVSERTDGKKELKDCICYKPGNVFYFCYEADEELNQYTPVFSLEPINVYELNKQLEESVKPEPLF